MLSCEDIYLDNGLRWQERLMLVTLLRLLSSLRYSVVPTYQVVNAHVFIKYPTGRL